MSDVTENPFANLPLSFQGETGTWSIADAIKGIQCGQLEVEQFNALFKALFANDKAITDALFEICKAFCIDTVSDDPEGAPAKWALPFKVKVVGDKKTFWSWDGDKWCNLTPPTICELPAATPNQVIALKAADTIGVCIDGTAVSVKLEDLGLLGDDDDALPTPFSDGQNPNAWVLNLSPAGTSGTVPSGPTANGCWAILTTISNASIEFSGGAISPPGIAIGTGGTGTYASYVGGGETYTITVGSGGGGGGVSSITGHWFAKPAP